jgi:hypothetical protein
MAPTVRPRRTSRHRPAVEVAEPMQRLRECLDARVLRRRLGGDQHADARHLGSRRRPGVERQSEEREG